MSEEIKSREFEPKLKATLVYRGDNPLMRELADSLSNLGIQIDQRVISVEDYDKSCDNPQEIKGLIGELEGAIITDITLENEVIEMGHEPINPYDIMEFKIESMQDVSNKIKPIIEEIKSKGKEPVVLQNFLGHHFFHGIQLPEEEENEIKKMEEIMNVPNEGEELKNNVRIESGNKYSAIINHELGTPIITRKYFRYGYLDNYGKDKDAIREAKKAGLFFSTGHYSSIGNCEKALESMGIKPDSAVLLVDHHVDIMSKEFIEKSGLSNIEIVPICPCCIGLKKSYTKHLESAGLKIFPLKYETDKSNVTEKLISLIKEKTGQKE